MIGSEGNDVEIDETFIGGRIQRKQHGGSPVEGKTVVFGMIERGGDVITHVVPNRKGTTIFPLVTASVRPATTVHTDEYSTYRSIGSLGYAHTTVNHAAKEYATVCGKGVNSIEGFWSQLKRSINGTHIHVSAKHLSKYLGEHEYRWNMRRQSHLMLDRLLVSFVR